uniref:M24 family metallopeptidase n=1 Tax=Rhodococcus sp. R1101 TaxID=1170698 RepID=UPI0003663CE2
MSADHASRRRALRALLADRDLDALLVTGLTDIRYLTGFTGSNAALIVSTVDDADETRTVVCTDGRYVTQVEEQVPDLRAVIARSSAARLITEFGTDAARWGFESHMVTVDERARWDELDVPVRFVPTPGLVEQLRAVKDEHEIGLLRDACGAADRALADLLAAGGLRPGRTEKEVARDLEWRMFGHGADGISFETIVAAGANSAVPHHRPTSAVLAEGDFVKLDFGARIGGYHSDMTRTYVLGRAADWQRDLYELVLRAQQAGREALAPGVECSAVDAAARTVIAEA